MDPERTLRDRVRGCEKCGSGAGAGSIESKAFVRRIVKKRKEGKEKRKNGLPFPFPQKKFQTSPFSNVFKFANFHRPPLSRSFSRISTYSNSKKKRKVIHDPTRCSRASISLSFFFERARNRPKRRSHQRGARNFLPTDKRERFGLALPMQSRRRPR